MPAACRRLRDDTRGLALVEFAICVPFLLLLFVGGFQISDGVFAHRKVTATARTVADLASQYTRVSDGDLDMILNASQQVLTPYRIASSRIRVSQITINASGNASVDWSRGKNTAALATGTTDVIPAAYRRPNTTVVLAQVTYNYVPGFASRLLGTIDLHDQAVMYPRKTTTIAKI